MAKRDFIQPGAGFVLEGLLVPVVENLVRDFADEVSSDATHPLEAEARLYRAVELHCKAKADLAAGATSFINKRKKR